MLKTRPLFHRAHEIRLQILPHSSPIHPRVPTLREPSLPFCQILSLFVRVLFLLLQELFGVSLQTLRIGDILVSGRDLFLFGRPAGQRFGCLFLGVRLSGHSGRIRIGFDVRRVERCVCFDRRVGTFKRFSYQQTRLHYTLRSSQLRAGKIGITTCFLLFRLAL